MKKFTAATIGSGAIAQALHLPGYAAREDIGRLVAVDVEPERLTEVKEAYRVDAVYSDYREMLAKETPDFVSICTPNVFHAEHAIAVLEAGAHLLLEKPMTITLESAREVMTAAMKARKQVMIGFSHRFMARNNKVKALLDAGAIGDPYMIRIRFAHKGPFPGWAKSDWFYKPELAGGGALLDMGIHAIDLCHYLIGPITSVAAQMGTLRKDIAVDDNAVLALTLGERTMGYIDVGWTSPAGFVGMEIYADKGAIVNNYAEPHLRVCSGSTSPDVTEASTLTWQDVEYSTERDGWANEINEFMDPILAGKAVTANLEAGISSLAVALGAIESAKTGRRVDLASLIG